MPQAKTAENPKKNAAKTAPKRRAKAPKKQEAAVETPSTLKSMIEPVTPKAEDVAITGNCFRLWANAWRDTFILRGRASRYELWSFLLINTVIITLIEFLCIYILSSNFLRTAHNLGYSLRTIDNFILSAQTTFYLCLFMPIFPLGSLLIRRMHDLNKLAWRGFLEPVFIGLVAISILHAAIYLLAETNLAYTILLLGLCGILTIYMVAFYGLKFLIMTLFYPGTSKLNAYGAAPQHNTPHYEEYALSFSCWFFILIATLLLFLLAIAIY